MNFFRGDVCPDEPNNLGLPMLSEVDYDLPMSFGAYKLASCNS